jgi:hypothetical protein
MSVIDSNGRLFGRINLVDAVVALVILILIPLAYATILLFRPARPHIDSATKVDITNEERRIVGGGSLLAAKIKVKGSAFNPMLRASIGGTPALAFVFENPNSADVLVGPMPPGAHDLVLFDGVQEVARLPGSVVIDRPSTRSVRAEGWLTNLDPAFANGLKKGGSFPPDSNLHVIAEIGAIAPAQSRMTVAGTSAEIPIAGRVERRAVITLACDPQGAELGTGQEPCTVGGQTLGGAVPSTVTMPGPVGIGFTVQEVFPNVEPSRAQVRLALEEGPETREVKVGDRDLLLDGRAARVSAVQGRSVTLDLGVDQSRDGWRYRGQLVKPGATLRFATDRYETRGRIESMSMPPKVSK